MKELLWMAAAVIALAALVWFCWYQNNGLTVTRYRLGGMRVSRPMKIVHLSDLHSKRFGKDNGKLLAKVAACSPDLIAVTGDFINDTDRRFCRTAQVIGRLCKLAPVVYIPGNHEYRSKEYASILEAIRQEGAVVLQNETAVLHVAGTPVCVLGLEERQGTYRSYRQMRRGKYRYRDYGKAFSALAQQPGLRLVLCHYPENFAMTGDKAYKQYDFDLQLSGHAHGGQWRFPLIGGLYAPGQGLFPKYVSGVFGDHPVMVVSRGLGRSSFPLRLFNRPEVVEITLTKESQPEEARESDRL